MPKIPFNTTGCAQFGAHILPAFMLRPSSLSKATRLLEVQHMHSANYAVHHQHEIPLLGQLLPPSAHRSSIRSSACATLHDGTAP